LGRSLLTLLSSLMSADMGVALIGVWTAHRAAKYWSTKDPQRVVIDEVFRPATRPPPRWLLALARTAHKHFRRTATPSCGVATAQHEPCDLAQLEIFAAGLYTFSSIRYLETVSPRGKPNLFPAAWESWPMTGSREFTRAGTLDRPGRSGFKSYRTQGLWSRLQPRHQESDKLGL